MRLIDADAIKYTARFTDYADGRMTSDAVITKCEIDSMPTVDPVRHGRWVYYEDETIDDGGRCSVCGCEAPAFWVDLQWKYVETDYCPICGSRMDGDEE